MSSSRLRIAIFASGAGSNARQLIRYFEQHPLAQVQLVVCNKPGAGVLDIAAAAGIATLMVERERFFRGDAYLPVLQQAEIGLVVLAGFLWKIPEPLVGAFTGRMVNIHPALLPKYGGKGMYGQQVHAAVLAAGETESGITIHFVDNQYDHGRALFQARCAVAPNDTPESLAARVHALEHEHYPRVVAALVQQLANTTNVQG